MEKQQNANIYPQSSAELKMLNVSLDCAFQVGILCSGVRDEAPAASSPPPARPPPPARSGALAGQPRSVLTLQEEVTSVLGCCAVALVVLGLPALPGSAAQRKVATFRQQPEQGFGVIVKIVSDVGQ